MEPPVTPGPGIEGLALPSNQVRFVRFLCVGLLVALGLGLWAHMPYLAFEHRRLQPWKIAGLWTGDIAALLWFLRFGFVHAMMKRPLRPERLSNRRKRLWWIGAAVIGPMLVDLGFTLYLMQNEKRAYLWATISEAEVLAVRSTPREAATWHELDCRFRDAAGVEQVAQVRIKAENDANPITRLISRGRMKPDGSVKDVLGLIQLRYDASFPARAWLDGAGWDDGNGVFWFSLLVLMFQAMLVALFLIVLVKNSANGLLPWWWSVYRILPLGVETFWMLTMGLIDRLLDHVK